LIAHPRFILDEKNQIPFATSKTYD